MSLKQFYYEKFIGIFNPNSRLILSAFCCEKSVDPPPDNPPEETSYCNCENATSPMTVVVSSFPVEAYISLQNDAYGANIFICTT